MFTLQLLISFLLCSRASLVSDIEDLPPAVQEKLFDEVLDRDVQKGDLLLSTRRCSGAAATHLR